MRLYEAAPKLIIQERVRDRMKISSYCPVASLTRAGLALGRLHKLILEVRIGQHIVDDHERVSEPDLVLSHHPIRNIMIWPSALIPDGKRFPSDIT